MSSWSGEATKRVDPRLFKIYKLILMSIALQTVQDMNPSFWHKAFERAQFFKSQPYQVSQFFKNSSRKLSVGLLFFEPSSRTRWSFQKACMDLDLSVMSSVVDMQTSLAKGEASEDTLELYLNMGFDLLILRSKEEPGFLPLIQDYRQNFINAGYGMQAHPTQAFLDCFSWRERLKEESKALKEPRLLILGDIKHSRVARSHLRLSQIMGYQVGLLPFEGLSLQAEDELLKNAIVFETRSEALSWADIVMPLRAQKERFSQGQNYQAQPLTQAELKADQLLMHPGPFMRDQDLESGLVKDSRSLIFEQVKNGVYCRAALMSLILEELK